ncbi:hypothetical protein [Methylobacterium iners]|uniref:Uncharacterized protein n=1 Tax=Methylobacterium iners TaxID=418707 RepID=A0ABQ4S552_9HYPH|nr:hypothetical protein [Methylobacterium iners]GJD97690.1 hypothetical protein OCOJLMKI_4923 [Methylobacterium iners]
MHRHPTNVVTLLTSPVPRKEEQCRSWARVTLTRQLAAFRAATSDPAVSLAPALTRAFDIFSVCVGYLARVSPIVADSFIHDVETFDEELLEDSGTQTLTYRFVYTLAHPLLETASTLRLHQLKRAVPRLRQVLYQAALLHFDKDPELNPLRANAWCWTLHQHFEEGRPERTMAHVSTLHETLRTAFDGSAGPTLQLVIDPYQPPPKWDSVEPVIEDGSKIEMETQDYEQFLARLQHRRDMMLFAPTSAPADIELIDGQVAALQHRLRQTRQQNAEVRRQCFCVSS